MGRVDEFEKVIIGNDGKVRRFKLVTKDKSIVYSGFTKYVKEDFEELIEDVRIP